MAALRNASSLSVGNLRGLLPDLLQNSPSLPGDKREEPRKEIDQNKHLPAAPSYNGHAAGSRGNREPFDNEHARPVSQHDHIMVTDQATWESYPQTEDSRGSHQKQLKETMRPVDRKETTGGFGFKSVVKGVSGIFTPPVSSSRYETPYPYGEVRSQPRHTGYDPHSRLIWLERENESNRSKIQELEAALEKEKLTGQQVKLSADKMQLKLDNKDAFMGAQFSDDIILDKFRQLFAAVKTWSTNFSGADFSEFEVKLDSVTNLRSVLPAKPIGEAVKALVASKNKTLRRIFRGWIAELFCTHVFRCTDRDFVSAPHDLWLDQQTNLYFSGLEDRLAYADRSQVSLRLLHDWRSFTAYLLSRLAARKEAETDRNAFSRDGYNQFLSFASHWVPDDRKPEVTKATRDLFTDAIKLSQLLRGQRANWSLRNLHTIVNKGKPRDASVETTYRFDKRIMREIDDEGYSSDEAGDPRHRVVDIFIEPALFKCGNADGEGFEIETCIEKALVSCLN